MPKFRKKPVVIEAIQYTGENMDELPRGPTGVQTTKDGVAVINTLEGVMRVDVGDWVIVGVAGEVYPCKPDIFEATYDRV